MPSFQLKIRILNCISCSPPGFDAMEGHDPAMVDII
jgi:hypothetical protein